MSALSALVEMSTVTVGQICGDQAVHTDSDYVSRNCTAIVSRDTQIIGEYAEVLAVVNTITLITAEGTARVGDTVTIAAGANAGVWRLVRRITGSAQRQNATSHATITFEAVIDGD